MHTHQFPSVKKNKTNKVDVLYQFTCVPILSALIVCDMSFVISTLFSYRLQSYKVAHVHHKCLVGAGITSGLQIFLAVLLILQ